MTPLSFNPMLMRAAAWSGVVLVAVFAFGMVVLSGFVPPPAPSNSAEVTAAWYRENTTLIRTGLLLSAIAFGLVAPWGASIAVWTRRSETRFPILTYTQLICVGFLLVDGFFTVMVWGVASFRPDEVSAEITQTWNDFGWFLFLWTWPPFSVWCIAIGLGVLLDESDNPAFPRWIGYFSFWVALLLVPAGAMIYFKQGPLGFNGLIAFWIPVAAFFPYMLAMTWAVLRATSAEEARIRLSSNDAQPSTAS